MEGSLIFRSFLLAVTVALFAGPTICEAKKTKNKDKRNDASRDSLAVIYVFYSEPPFAYEPGEKISIKIRSSWDRDKKERRIREKVAKAGGSVVVLTSSHMEYDRDPQIIPRRGGRRGEPIYTLDIPTRSIYVVGHVGTRVDGAPQRDIQRMFRHDFFTVWDAVVAAIKSQGWHVEKIDTDSRYLVTAPVTAGEPTMQCEDNDSGEQWPVFTIYVNTYADRTMVRFDVSFLDPSSGEPSACRSRGDYEQTFFRRLDALLED